MAKRERVLSAMSGGVDSSVATLLLRDAGYEVAGATMRLFGNEVLPDGAESSCCSLSDVEDARQVAFGLGLEHFTFNFTDVFEHEVMDRFCDAYLHGRTPNPCIDCNRYLKFAALQRRRAQLGYDYVATGHYARRVYDGASGRYRLLRGLDPAKDQSYVLYHLTQDDLAHMLFPLGELTKARVREIAAEHAFGNAEKAESQDICFVPDGDYVAFIERYLAFRTLSGAEAFCSGDIVDCGGKVLGRHRGLIHYTIGQRKGIGVAAPEPLYVLAKDAARNELVVGLRHELGVTEVRANDVNLISVAQIDAPLRVQAKTHYRQTAQPAWAAMDGDELVVTFDEPVARPAAGQALVLYDGDAVVGGGTIR